MSYNLERELARFHTLSTKARRLHHGEIIAEDAVALTPAGGPVVRPAKHRYALTILGLIHGNETAGLAVLNEVLEQIVNGELKFNIPVALAIGNREAARQGKRFVDRDLNRSFAAPEEQRSTREGQRAKALEGVLAETAYLLDLHQVSRPSGRPFFIFPYRRQGLALARALHPRLTVVTHWGKSFSQDGMCSDEFVIKHGGQGITLELGQNGFDPYQIALGTAAASRALRVVSQWLETPGSSEAVRPGPSSSDDGELYTWAAQLPWPQGNLVELKANWQNFDEIKEGTELGHVDGQAILAPCSGRLLFPKYLSEEEQKRPDFARPAELCRILKSIRPQDLPEA